MYELLEKSPELTDTVRKTESEENEMLLNILVFL